MKILLTTVALAALAASPAFAAPHKSAAQTAPTGTYSSYAAAPNGSVVISDGDFVGSDPDLNVQLQLRRDAQSYQF